MKNVQEIRYDLTSDIATLDGESQLGLLDLGVAWSERNAQLAAELIDLSPWEDLGQWSALLLA